MDAVAATQILSGSEIRDMIQKAHKWTYVPKVDKLYFLPSADFVQAQLLASRFEYWFRAETADCDDVAFIILGKIKERQFKERWVYPMAFGACTGNLADGRAHVSNCAYTADQGLVYFDYFKNDMDGFRPRMVWI